MADFSCNEESLSAFLDGELSQEESRKIKNHLQTCTRCREIYNRIQVLSEAVQEIPSPMVNPAFAAQIINQLKSTGTLGESSLIKLFKSWGILSLFTLSVMAVLFGPILLGLLYVVTKYLVIIISVVVKLSWQLPLNQTNILLGLIFIIGASISFYGFGRVYSAISGEELAS